MITRNPIGFSLWIVHLKVCLYKAKLEGELYIEEKINKQLKINDINKNNIEEYKNLQCMFVF